MMNKAIFNHIYLTNEWGGDSGVGSIPANAIEYIDTVTEFINNNNIKSVLDLGSGDTKILRQILSKINIDSYTCIEISSVAINRYYQDIKDKIPNLTIINDDIISCSYPKCDLILIKDVLQHLSFNSIFRVMHKIFDGCKYGIITNDALINTNNINITNGHYRGLDLTKYPFNYNLTHIKSYSIEKEPAPKVMMLYSNVK